VTCRKPSAPECLNACRDCAKIHPHASQIFKNFPRYKEEGKGKEGEEGRAPYYYEPRAPSDQKTTLPLTQDLAAIKQELNN
jgi:hypothetical protein